MILNQPQAAAVYAAMCELNTVNGKITACFGDADSGITVIEGAHGVRVIGVHDSRASEIEDYADQHAFEAAYELDEESTRAQMVIEGSHPTLTYSEIIDWFDLDDSFVYTASEFKSYVTAYVKGLEKALK